MTKAEKKKFVAEVGDLGDRPPRATRGKQRACPAKGGGRPQTFFLPFTPSRRRSRFGDAGTRYVSRDTFHEIRFTRKAFTLIEMLLVIGIIGILAGFMFTAASMARKRARIAQARTEAADLAKAWKSYWMIYGEWPAGYENVPGGQPMNSEAVNILQGGNPQGINFMDLDSDVITDGFRDPWGQWYRVRFDFEQTFGRDYYETTVYFPNRKRYDYE